ncbi:MAG: thiamine phosphate synthase [Polyangiaceae bacterium]
MKLRGLYAIVDTTSLAAKAIDPISFAHDVLVAKPAALQLRAKNAGVREVARLASRLVAMCSDARVPFVVNDHPAVAWEVGAGFAHLGQEDGAQPGIRVEVGRSTHSCAQLEEALSSKPAYVAYGPIFATSSKKNPSAVVGLEGLREARRVVRASASPDTPLVAIGGISLENAAKIAEFADAAAVIAALICDDVARRARDLHAALGGST